MAAARAATTRLIAALLLGGAVLTAAAAGPAWAVDILLTNDDGFDAPGITALRTALLRAGHDVTVIAPSSNRSGSSASLTFAPIRVERVEPDVFSVDSSPASSVILGVGALLGDAERPDLVVSGINSGANIGPSTVISGTVGAAVAAITNLDRPIPAIAVSTDLVDGDADSPANRRHFAEVADFTARLIGRLTGGDRLTGLRPGLGLNVNYPPLPANRVRGVRIAVQGKAVIFAPSFEETEPGLFVSTARPVPPRRDVEGSDTISFYQGFATVVPIDADYTAAPSVRAGIARELRGLTP